MIWIAKKSPEGVIKLHIDDFIIWATLGIILGGRLGYVLFYNFSYYRSNPIDILALWQGGMSFHGGLVGVTVAVYLFSKRRGYNWIAFGDIVACAAPIGLFLGRVANFVNAELYGRITDSPLGMVFPGGGELPRHPSQLYEAFLEGLVLFFLLFLLLRQRNVISRSGLLGGVFLLGYGIARFFVEFYREPDMHIGLMTMGTTMGQWLSLPLILLGIWLIVRANKHEPT